MSNPSTPHPVEPVVRKDFIQGALKRFRDMSLKNKIFFSILAVILFISAIIAFLARWILVSTLISELELRGIAIARTIAERSSGFILDKNRPELLSLIFDEAKLKERQNLVSYIFVSDRDDQILSHTLTRRFPESLRLANRVPALESKSVRLCQFGSQMSYDIATPVAQGIYRIGTVHVGLNKNHIDQLVAKLRFTFLGFLSMVIVIVFVISHWLAKYITLPISRLTQISDELSKGNFDMKLEIEPFTDGNPPPECPAFVNTDLPCWHLDGTALTGEDGVTGSPPAICMDCHFYHGHKGDEVVQLANSFYNMIWSIRLYRRRLRVSEKKYRSLFDSGPDPIFVVSSKTFEIIDANPRAEEVYGYSKEELIGKSFTEMGPEHTREFFQSLQDKTDSDGLVNYPKALHYKKGHKPLYVNLHACNITYKGLPAIVVASTDITEMIEKDAQLIQASKMKSLGEMSAGIAHELNQPLNAIKMGSDFLCLMVENNREIPPEHLREVVTEMSTQVDRSAEIINTLRAFGRKSELIMERLDINKPIQAVFTLVVRQFELDNIRIELRLAEPIVPIMAQDNRLQQVFFNLVTNARDAITEKNEGFADSRAGKIIIRTYQDGDWVLAEVEDDGIGIADGVRDKIFEPFFSTKDSSIDMGLGLAITYGIVKDYGGGIELVSQEGMGAVFRLRFPVA
ncbi:MAG: PAS domain S-box protein [Desulfatirhabdiaceae bacterium]|nr:PAS domain S-box protein [Desulfatirhabdiaceae bacterium]